MPPIHVRIMTSATSVQNNSCDSGRKVSPCCLEVCSSGTTNNTRIEKSSASTPPSLLGIDRRIAYANRKYHSGLICGGVTSGLAGVKFSGSPRRLGANRARDVRVAINTANPRISLYEKYGWKEILSESEFSPIGLLDPVSCRNRACSKVAAMTANGSKKWKAKNRVRVALSTENPPQIHCTKVSPI